MNNPDRQGDFKRTCSSLGVSNSRNQSCVAQNLKSDFILQVSFYRRHTSVVLASLDYASQTQNYPATLPKG